MTEINDALHGIDSKLDSVLAMMAAEKKAKVKNAIDIARSYMQLHRDYFDKPLEARQAARNEIEARYNDVGEVVDWLSEQLIEIQGRASSAKATEKGLSKVIEEFRPYDDQFDLCVQALTALAISRMYYDGCVDEQNALVEHQRIQRKTQQFLRERQKLIGILELKIGSLKGSPVALPQGGESGSVFKRLVSQTPRAAARSQLLDAKVAMQSELRESTAGLKANSRNSVAGIDRVVAAGKAARTVLTDGENCWIVGESVA